MSQRVLGCWLFLALGCSCSPTPPVPSESAYQNTSHSVALDTAADELKQYDYRLLFIGNSHTSFHNVPNLVCQMIEHVQPGKKARAAVIGVAFLDDTARDDRTQRQLERHVWQQVILQAQKISMSGKFHYSTREGIALAQQAQANHAEALFYAEWGMQGVANDGPRTEAIYQTMATDAKARVARVGRAWDIALAKRPNMPLYSGDGNHQSATGAFLTACVLCGAITGADVSSLATFPYLNLSAAERERLAACAAEALAERP